MDKFYLRERERYPRRDGIWTEFWRMIWHLQRTDGRGESKQKILQRHGVLTLIFTPIPIGIANPNTNIPSIKNYCEFGAIPNSLIASFKSYKILQSRNYYYLFHLQISNYGWKIHIAGTWGNLDSETHIWSLGYTVLRDVGILTKNRVKINEKIIQLEESFTSDRTPKMLEEVCVNGS